MVEFCQESVGIGAEYPLLASPDRLIPVLGLRRLGLRKFV